MYGDLETLDTRFLEFVTAEIVFHCAFKKALQPNATALPVNRVESLYFYSLITNDTGVLGSFLLLTRNLDMRPGFVSLVSTRFRSYPKS